MSKPIPTVTPTGAPRGVRPLLLVGALANPTVRELLEMQYQFEEPFVVVDSSKISALLQVSATPLEQAVEATISGYRSAALSTSGQPR